MKRIVIFIVLFLLTFSLAAAVEVSTNKVSYTSGETVTATIDDCQGTSIVKFINPTSDLVDIKSGQIFTYSEKEVAYIPLNPEVEEEAYLLQSSTNAHRLKTAMDEIEQSIRKKVKKSPKK